MSNNGMNQTSVLKGIPLRLDSAIKGCQTAFPPGIQTLPIRNATYGQADINNKLVALDAPWKGAQTLHATIRQFGLDKPGFVKAAEQFLADLKAALAGAVGSDNELLGQWGFKVAKPKKPLTAEQNALRAAKARSTRQKRGTKGKRQKAAIKGADPTSVQITPGSPPVIVTNDGSTPPPPPPPPVTH